MRLRDPSNNTPFANTPALHGRTDAGLTDFLRTSEMQGPYLLRRSAPEGATLTAETCTIHGVEYIAAVATLGGLERREWFFLTPSFIASHESREDARQHAAMTAAGVLAMALSEAREPRPTPLY